MLFDGWMRPAQVLVVGSLAYLSLIVILRLSGKRTLAKLSAFDFLVTVALGSSLATVILSRSTPLLEGLTGLLLLVALQFAISYAAVRWGAIRRLIKSEPVLLFERGAFLDTAMKRERVGRDDILSAIRKAGGAQLSDVLAVVLESDGSISVMRGNFASDLADSALVDVRGAHDARRTSTLDADRPRR